MDTTPRPNTDAIETDAPHDLVIVGGGAAGVFAAAVLRPLRPTWRIAILEQAPQPLGKVRISGGGRCNLTHDVRYAKQLLAHYPRGQQWLRRVFDRWDAVQTQSWFAARGVTLKTEADGRVFPTTDDSETIIRALLDATQGPLATETGAAIAPIPLLCRAGIRSLGPATGGLWHLTQADGRSWAARRVLLAVGGYGQARQYDWIADGTGHRLVPPVPSLFTFNVPDSPLLDLAGVSVPEARVRVAQSDWAYDGPLLLTHWGISGPAVLKTSAWAARHLALAQYDFRVLIDWLPSQTHAQTEDWLRGQAQAHPNRQVANYPPEGLPRRLWERLCVLAAVPQATTWAQLPRKPRGRLLDFLRRMELHCRSKTTHKDEFVTAGGIDLSEVDPQTLRSRLHDNLWFAGELLDVDGLTGGFNFQAAWSTAWLAAQSLATV